MRFNFKIIFRPICWFQEWYRTVTRSKSISGHDFIGDDPYDDLVCEICGYVSKGDRNE